MRRVISTLVMSLSLVLISSAPAFAAAPHHVMIGDAACNSGSAAARVISGNGVVPMYMVANPTGCMVMPGAFTGP